MKKPEICAAVVNDDVAAVKRIEPLVDLFELRIDLIGEGWREVAKALAKPWLACNRRKAEGGGWKGGEEARITELLNALELKPAIVDIELASDRLAEIIPLIKKKAQCLISHHDFKKTPSLDELKTIVRKQVAAGADICKVVTTAKRFADNLTVLQLIPAFPETRIVSFAMGPLGHVSRVLSPLAGGEFIYASIQTGRESAPGQITVTDLRRLYEVLKQ
jgi:3-dehydroquinate dehydratase-1